MNTSTIHQLGDELYNSLRYRRVVAPPSTRHVGMSVEDAYQVQQRVISRRLQDGERIIGKKIGITSPGVREMLGVVQPNFGHLLDTMVVIEGESIDISALIQPRAEGEIAFVLKRELSGPGVDNADVLAATECVMPCMEIVDSRIRDWKISIEDSIADNASCGVFVLGHRALDPRRIDLSTCGMVFEMNGDLVTTSAGAATLGSPFNAVAWLANTLGRFGQGLAAGDIVLSGALAAMVPAQAGDSFRVSIGGLGGCSVRFH